jgi:outer membrane lipoprotein LolB
MREAREQDGSFFASRVKRHVLLVFTFGMVTLTGCSLTPRVEPVANRDASELTDWQASGRIAVAGANAGGSGSFIWQQHGTRAQVQMHGPIGIGSLKLTLTDETIRIETADGQVFEADEAQSELTARLGASVPARNLRYWLVGVAAPGEHQWLNSTDAATLTTLTQENWRIDYQRYGVTSGTRLPTKLVAVNGPARVRIVIDRWALDK